MPKIKLLIANANNKFNVNQIKNIESATVLAEKFISNSFDFDYEVDVIVVPSSCLFNAIPEDGISGRTYQSDMILISINTDLEISEDLFYETLCHELSHSIRFTKVLERSKSLINDIILEGLAVVLEEEAMADEKNINIQFFLKEMQKTDETTAGAVLNVLKNDLQNNKYDYDKIFIGGDDTLPRWAGYRLGYYLVKKYLQETGKNIYQATLDNYDKFQR